MKRVVKQGFCVLTPFLAFTMAGAPIFAQEVTGSIRGEVLDPSDAGVPSAEVSEPRLKRA